MESIFELNKFFNHLINIFIKWTQFQVCFLKFEMDGLQKWEPLSQMIIQEMQLKGRKTYFDAD